MSNYRGVYINLDRSAGRRAAMEAQLEKSGAAPIYSRFAAIDGRLLKARKANAISSGEEGAFRSQAEALRQAAFTNLPLHVLEDDALLSASTRGVIEEAIASGLLDRFDILLTDTFVAPDLGLLKVLSHAFGALPPESPQTIGLRSLQLIDVSRQNFASLTSYVVSPRAAQRVATLLAAELESGPRLPIDLFLRQCAHAGKITAALLAPFVTSFNLDEVRQSTIAAGAAAAKPSVMVMAVLRHLFFVERDLKLARACLESAIGPRQKTHTEQSQLVIQALEFILSDEFRQF